MRQTAVIQIGNSDNKLTQQEWAHYVVCMNETIRRHVYEIHFFGGSDPFAPWQNAAWIVELLEGSLEQLRQDVSAERKRFNQDSVAMMIGETEFV